MTFSYEVYNKAGALVTTNPTFKGAKLMADKFQGVVKRHVYGAAQPVVIKARI